MRPRRAIWLATTLILACSDDGGAPDAARDAGADLPVRDALPAETLGDGPATDRPVADQGLVVDQGPDGPPAYACPGKSCTFDGWCDESLLTVAYFNGAWASGPGDIFAVGEMGAILHYDGSSWSTMSSPFTSNHLYAVWGSGPSDVFAVGGDAVILHYDGKSWTKMQVPASVGANDVFNGVWGSGPGNVYAVGPDHILRYNGSSWSEVATGVVGNGTINGVWGSGPGDVFAVGQAIPGYGAVVYHFDGASWTSMAGVNTGSYSGLRAVWGTGPNNVFAVGDSMGAKGRIAHYNGSQWTDMPNPSTDSLYGVGGSGPGNVFAVGGDQLLRYDGSSWTKMPDLSGRWLYAVTAAPSGPVIAAGHVHNSAAVLTYGGAAWSVAFRGLNVDLKAIWGTGAKSLVAAGMVPVGPASAALHFDGSTWAPKLTFTSQTDISGVWGTGPGDVYVVGRQYINAPTNKEGLAFHYDGAAWSTLPYTDGFLSGVWAAGPGEVWAVGNNYQESGYYPPVVSCQSMVVKKNGPAWQGTPEMLSTTHTLEAVWGSGPGNIFAVGGCDPCKPGVCDGLIWHYDGSSWSKQTSGTTEPLHEVWGSGASDVFAVGSAGTILHHDGSAWSAMTSGVSDDLFAVSGNGAGDVYAVGGSGTILHYDGASWSKLASGVTLDLQGVWVGPKEAYVVADDGTVLHRCSP